ncbi:MAG TPA: polyamine aminopropyltransferase, partial [Flavisolibacter sp.]|nr:polyamine aminopropyltransferase [Flavisolibacter sp.]
VFPLAASFRLILYSLVFLTGVLVGLEIPMLMRILKDKVEFNELVSQVFTFDYIGALLASLIFPLLLVPHLGLIRTSLFFGILNIVVGWYLALRFSKEVKEHAILKASAITLLLIELGCFVFSDRIMNFSETLNFDDNIVYSKSSSYQRIVLTKNKKEMRLFLNGNLQFSSADEYRYHEALVHPALSSVSQPNSVLVLGGGDGLAVREILKYPSVKKVVLVDLDPAMTELFKTQSLLTRLNQKALLNPKVTVINGDAFAWLRANTERFDAIVVDFPDPSNFSIGKLYSTTFYQLLKKTLAPQGMAVVQSTSPFAAPRSFWCIDKTIQTVGLQTKAYHNYVPSFGEWGYILVMQQKPPVFFNAFPEGLKFINHQVAQQMLVFPEDMRTQKPIEPNRLNNQVLVNYFEEEWSHYLAL